VVDRPRVDQLLALLGRYIRILRELAAVPLDEYADDLTERRERSLRA
jgi:hypothetical protein